MRDGRHKREQQTNPECGSRFFASMQWAVGCCGLFRQKGKEI